ncbi:MAG: aconitase family protein [Olsenella sp.]|nr:aconitase family protein [Olsenella sp.]
MARPMTMAEKILADHAGLTEVVPGQLIECDLDGVLANDITAPIAIKTVREIGAGVFDPTKIFLVPDHYSPNKDIKSAEQTKVTRDFAHEMGITHYFEQGCMGIEHALLPEKGIVGPGDLIIGADSHTCTYGGIGAFSTGVGSTDAGVGMATGRAWFKVPETIRFEVEGELPAGASAKDIILYVIGKIGVDGALDCAMEFAGSTIRNLSVEGRLTIANMAIEAGGKAGLFEVDDVARKWLEGRTERPYKGVPLRPGRHVQAGHQDRRGGHRAAGLLAAPAQQHAPRGREPLRQDRPGGHRLLHQRPHRGYARRRGRPARPHRRPQRPLHRDPRDPGRLAPVRARGPHGRVHQRALRGVHPHVRSLPGRLHGHPRGGREVRELHEQKLRRAHGRPHVRGLPREPRGLRGKRRGRPHRAAVRPLTTRE